jgi:hypothetical protein
VRGKRGQLYILVAIILLTYAFAISRPSLAVDPPISSFRALRENAMLDGAVVVNNALFRQENVSAVLNVFSGEFSQFAKTRDPNFAFAYFLVDADNLVVISHLRDVAKLTSAGLTVSVEPSGTYTMQKPNVAVLEVGGYSYEYQFSNQQYQLKGFFRKQDKGEVRVHAAS